jgi:hypothetical protein
MVPLVLAAGCVVSGIFFADGKPKTALLLIAWAATLFSADASSTSDVHVVASD